MEEKLINAVAGFPLLYDLSLFTYRDINKKNDAWTKVSEIVGVSADECRKRWKSLRDTFRKERRKEAERKRSGAGASSVRPWRYSGVMGFLNPFIEDRLTDSNMVGWVGEALTPEEREDAMARHRQAEETAQGKAGHSLRRKRAHDSGDFDERMLTALEAVSRRVTTPEDSDSLFFKSLLEDFRMLSVRTRQDLKFQIHRLVYEARCLEAEHNENCGESNGTSS